MNPFPERRDPIDGEDPSLARVLMWCFFIGGAGLVVAILCWPIIHHFAAR